MQIQSIARLILIAVAGTLVFSRCLVVDNTYSGLPPGPWRAVLKLENNPVSPNPKGEPLPEKLNIKFDEVSEGELPFTFEVKYDNPDKFHIQLKNGVEIIRIDNITIGRDPRTAKDTVIISFPANQSRIRAIFDENIMEGYWIVPGKEDKRIHFVAWHGDNYRFTQLRKPPVADLNGSWKLTVGLDTEKPYPATANFTQQGNYLTATIATDSVNYLPLEGTIQADKLYLSRFDGKQALLYEGKLAPDGTIIGAFRSANEIRSIWSGIRETEPDQQQ